MAWTSPLLIRRVIVVVKLDRLLCSVDFSEASRHALQEAVALARWYASEVTVLHVMQSRLGAAAPIGEGRFAPFAPVPLPRGYLDTMTSQLREFVESVDTRGVTVRQILLEGPIVDTILVRARELSADMLVMGTHGRSGLDRLLLGSVAERVLRRAECPVLTVPNYAVGTPHVFRRILCAVDFSDASLEALSYALSLAQEANARLIVLHVNEFVHANGRPGPKEAAFRREYAIDARRRVMNAIPRDARTYCSIRDVIADGSAHEAILDLASDEGADLIVIGLEYRRAADLLFFGSTTHRVVRQANCPILTVLRSPVGAGVDRRAVPERALAGA